MKEQIVSVWRCRVCSRDTIVKSPWPGRDPAYFIVPCDYCKRNPETKRLGIKANFWKSYMEIAK